MQKKKKRKKGFRLSNSINDVLTIIAEWICQHFDKNKDGEYLDIALHISKTVGDFCHDGFMQTLKIYADLIDCIYLIQSVLKHLVIEKI